MNSTQSCTFDVPLQVHSRQLASADIQLNIADFQNTIQCPNPGEVLTTLNWKNALIVNGGPDTQVSDLGGGFLVSFTKSVTGTAKISYFGTVNYADGSVYPAMSISGEIEAASVIVSGSATNEPPFPQNWVTMDIEFLSQSIK